MAAGAAGGFITRALESTLKKCSNKKYSTLHTAIQSYFGTMDSLQSAVKVGRMIREVQSDSLRVMKGQRVGEYVQKNAPAFCHVDFVGEEGKKITKGQVVQQKGMAILLQV